MFDHLADNIADEVADDAMLPMTQYCHDQQVSKSSAP